jgi:TetR/AcrR family transcriptional repressor of nem operon
MARKREFDYDRAIEKAMRVFWTKGYGNTSMRDLLQAMEIGEGSFYNVVRGKKELYLACLERYNELVTERRLAILESEKSVRKAVRKAFKAVIAEIHDRNNPPGCLMANSLFADVLVDADLRRTVTKEMNRFSEYFVKRLAAAKRSGELPEDFPVRPAAQSLVTFLQGMFRVAYTVNSKKELQQQVETVLAGLRL